MPPAARTVHTSRPEAGSRFGSLIMRSRRIVADTPFLYGLGT